jgi:uncharacterized protein YegP (UPF0339 family)
MALTNTAARAAFKAMPEANGTNWYWTLRAAGNHEVVATDRGYKTRDDAISGISVVRGYAPNAPVYDLTKGAAPSGTRFEVYTDTAGQWRYRFMHGGYNFAQGEGYWRRESVMHAIDVVKREAPSATVS